MSSKLSLAGIIYISASEDGIWTLITDYSISNTYDMHSFVLVSKSFYQTLTNKGGRFSKIVGRSFASLLRSFFAPLCNRGIKELDLLDSFFKFLNQFQYECLIVYLVALLWLLFLEQNFQVPNGEKLI
jgi:hypothetical protein